VGGMVAAVNPATGIQLTWTERPTGSEIPLPDLRCIVEVIHHHVRQYLRDQRYEVFWNEDNEDTGIETLVNELP
jgi:hypothetical protein